MSAQMPELIKLEDSILWKEANELAEHVSGKLHELPEEEKWDTTSKLRSSAVELMFYVAQAVGSASPSGAEYEWSNARKSAYALKTLYRFAGRQQYFELDPAMMVKLNHMTTIIDSEVAAAYQRTEQYEQEEFDRWREKYKLWKAIKK